MEHDLALLSEFFPDGALSYNPYAPVWGWNRSFVAELKSFGYTNLPTEAQLNEIRQLSSRKTAVEILPQIINSLPSLPLVGQSTFCASEDEFCTTANRGNCILKELFSGSGRGLRFVSDNISEAQRNWALRCIREQGGIVVEPLYEKNQDFALEFLVTESEVIYIGLSVFDTDCNNAYSGNYIAPQENLWKYLYNIFDKSVYKKVIACLTTHLFRRFVGHYLGPLGVDMMITKDNNSYRIHPCVEINVRRTMGELSLHLFPLLSFGKSGFFSLLFAKDSKSLHTIVSQLPKPCYSSDGKLISGTKVLTPLLPDTHYVALLDIRPFNKTI